MGGQENETRDRCSISTFQKVGLMRTIVAAERANAACEGAPRLSLESRDSRFTGNARRAEAPGAGGGARASLADAAENKGESETK